MPEGSVCVSLRLPRHSTHQLQSAASSHATSDVTCWESAGQHVYSPNSSRCKRTGTHPMRHVAASPGSVQQSLPTDVQRFVSQPSGQQVYPPSATPKHSSCVRVGARLPLHVAASPGSVQQSLPIDVQDFSSHDTWPTISGSTSAGAQSRVAVARRRARRVAGQPPPTRPLHARTRTMHALVEHGRSWPRRRWPSHGWSQMVSGHLRGHVCPSLAS